MYPTGVAVVAFAGGYRSAEQLGLGGYRSAEQLGLGGSIPVVADLRLVIEVLATLGSA